MCSCFWLYQMLSLLRQKEKLFYQWAFCLFPSLLVLARLCPVKYLTDGLVGIAFTLPTLDCFSFLHLFWTRYWISKKVRRNAQSIWKNLILDMREKNIMMIHTILFSKIVLSQFDVVIRLTRGSPPSGWTVLISIWMLQTVNLTLTLALTYQILMVKWKICIFDPIFLQIALLNPFYFSHLKFVLTFGEWADIYGIVSQ